MQLFEIKEITREDNIYTFEAELNGENKIFEGHFPQNPVVPGVCTMAMVKSCCGLILGRAVNFDYIKEVKFLSAILPSQHKVLSVVVTLKGSEDDAAEISTLVSAQGVTMMKLKATVR